MLRNTTARVRASLLVTTAMFALPSVAHAQDGADGPLDRSQAVIQAQGAGAAITINPADVQLEAQGAGLDPVQPEPQIIIANPNTPTTARDPVNITGVSQMVVDAGGGFINLCTATLINPRTVIFAAHCVNDRNATAYGANSGGTAIGFGFETNTRANAAGQTDELVNWLLGSGTGPGKYKTNIAQAFYNSNWVNYNPYSLEPAAQDFLYGDVAVAALDTPAANIPTWALLFSPLTNTGAIGAAGTGFNVGLVGYGNNGTGQTGAAGIDYRRRSAENILGALTDLQTFESFLFGGAPNGLSQNLYFLDFDDPRRGMNTASPFDFNAFRDNARAGANGGASLEGITSEGDSGGPLILQNFSKQLVIGVLSGGYSRFFNGQAANSYGTVSFYQPLYLYWDWIAANNPYHYVAAKAGDGQWTDPTHWVTTLDPSYYILTGGQPVNGVPTVAGEQKNGTSGDFGQICFQSGGVSDCYDTRTGNEVVEQRPIGTAADQPADQAVATAESQPGAGVFDGVVREAQATAQALPAATVANGLPGATNFVPVNADPVRTAGTAPRYFDVTLSANGITTLSGANVTIDRLTVGTAGAQLVIANGASLSTLINTTQLAGFVTVDGTLTSTGDYSLLGGGLLGSGRINAPFLTSILGQIAPGTTSTIGTLTIAGNLVLASGTNYFVNLGSNGTSDRLAVIANGTSAGAANLGGTVTFSRVAGQTVRAGDVFTILTAAGGVTGIFANPTALSAIITPQFIYSANAVQARLVAGLYRNVIGASDVQYAYAQLLDQNRAQNYNALAELYDAGDWTDAASIRSTFESWAPRAETLVRAVGTVATENMQRFYRERLAGIDPNTTLDGSLTVIGNPLQVAASRTGTNIQTGVESLANGEDTTVEQGRLPEGMRGYFAGGYLTGQSASMASAVPFGGKDDFDGWYVAAGVETQADPQSVFGLGVSYTKVDGTTGGAPQGVNGELYEATLYSKLQTASDVVLDVRVSAGFLGIETRRTASLGATVYNLQSRDDTFVYSSELGVAKMFGGPIKVGPRVAVRAGNIDYTPTVEGGGPMALRYDRGDFRSLQGLAGATLSGSTAQVQPFAAAYYVHEFRDAPGAFGANFANGIGPDAVFGLAGQDHDWGELSAGLSFDAQQFHISLSADTTVLRDDIENQSYRGSVTMKF